MTPDPIVTVRVARNAIMFTDQLRNEYDGGRGFVFTTGGGAVTVAGQGYFELTRRQATQLRDWLDGQLAHAEPSRDGAEALLSRMRGMVLTPEDADRIITWAQVRTRAPSNVPPGPAPAGDTAGHGC